MMKRDALELNAEVERVIAQFPTYLWGMSAGGPESGWMLVESVSCYRNGLFVASLLTAHASCEREIAGRIAHADAQGQGSPRNWMHWGLGPLVEHAASQGWYSEDARSLMRLTNDYRRSIAHYREYGASDSLFTRTFSHEQWTGKHDITEKTRTEVSRNALIAIEAAFAVRADD